MSAFAAEVEAEALAASRAEDVLRLVEAAEEVTFEGELGETPAAGGHGGDAGGGPPAAPPAPQLAPPGGPGGIDWELVRRCHDEPETDIGNGRRFLIRNAEDVIWVQRVGFFVFDARRWAEDVQDARVRPLAHATVEAIALEASVVAPTEMEAAAIAQADEVYLEFRMLTKKGRHRTDEDEVRLKEVAAIVEEGKRALAEIGERKGKRLRYAKTSGNKGKIDGMLNEAAPYLSRPLSELDADPLALNLENGTLRLLEVPDPECPDPEAERTKWIVRLDGHDRADLISKLAPAEYDAGAAAPLFEAFMATVLPDPSVRAYLQRYFGYALTALTREQVFVILHGEGRNGKSTLVDIVCRVMGDYATSLPVSTLINGGDARRGAEATPDLAMLPGSRLVRTAEPKEGLPLDESVVKSLTSGEPVPVRRLNQEFVHVYPTFKLIISVNRKPNIHGNDDGIWRRVNLVPFDVQIPPEEVDKRLPEKLWAERAGILNWLIAGALDYLGRGGLDPPEAVLAATGEYRDESDIVGAFVRAALEVTGRPIDKATPGELYAAFAAWCRQEAKTVLKENTFTRRLPKVAARYGIDKGKASITVYSGVRIRDAFLTPPGGSSGFGWGGSGGHPSRTP